MILCTPPVTGEIVIVPTLKLKSWKIYPSWCSVSLTDKTDFLSEIIISPCRSENYVSGLLLKLKIICETFNIKLTTVGAKNYFPFYSMFSDEVVLSNTNHKQTWYHENDGSLNGINVEPILDLDNFIELDWEDMKNYHAKIPYREQPLNHLKSLAQNIPDDLVAERFGDWKCFILEDSYEKFISIQNTLSRDIIIPEIKKESLINDETKGYYNLFDMSCNKSFQQDVLSKTGTDHYLTTQILASNFLNWNYFCCGGAINLFCVVPVKVIGAIDAYMSEGVIRELARVRYGLLGEKLPPLLKAWAWDKNTIQFMQDNMHLMIKGFEYLSLCKKPKITTKYNT